MTHVLQPRVASLSVVGIVVDSVVKILSNVVQLPGLGHLGSIAQNNLVSLFFAEGIDDCTAMAPYIVDGDSVEVLN